MGLKSFTRRIDLLKENVRISEIPNFIFFLTFFLIFYERFSEFSVYCLLFFLYVKFLYSLIAQYIKLQDNKEVCRGQFDIW